MQATQNQLKCSLIMAQSQTRKQFNMPILQSNLRTDSHTFENSQTVIRVVDVDSDSGVDEEIQQNDYNMEASFPQEANSQAESSED